MRLGIALSFLLCAASVSADLTADESDSGLSLALSTPKREYSVGEIIPLSLQFAYSGKKEIRITQENQISPRQCQWGLEIRDSRGRRMPPTVFQWGFLGGSWTGGLKPGYDILRATSPVTRASELNDCFAPTKPGIYTVIASYGSIKSPPLAISISPASESFIRETLSKAVPASTDQRMDRRQAIRILRFLMDPRAVPPLVAALDDDDQDVGYDAYLGLLGFPDRKEVARAVGSAISKGRPRQPGLIHFYSDLLARAETGIAADNFDGRIAAYSAAEERWSRLIESRRKPRHFWSR